VRRAPCLSSLTMDKEVAQKIERARMALNDSELLRERLRVLDEALAESPVAEYVNEPAAQEHASGRAQCQGERARAVPPIPQRT
jgi:hypothetical protein